MLPPFALLLIVLLLVAFGLSGLLWVGALWLQGYIYESATPGLGWRAPAAGGALGLLVALWCLIDYGYGVSHPDQDKLLLDATPWDFSPTEPYPAKPFPKFISVKGGKETVYYRRPTGQRIGAQYHYVDDNDKPWSRESNGVVEAIIVEEDGEKVRYNLDLPGGKFPEGEVARYVEDGGRHRVLTENDVRAGQITVFRSDRFILNILLTVLHLGAWFACLWLLVRFQWSHALGLAVVLWLVAWLALFPPLLSLTRQAVHQRSPTSPTALLVGGAR
jgi:hypothetical protein